MKDDTGNLRGKGKGKGKGAKEEVNLLTVKNLPLDRGKRFKGLLRLYITGKVINLYKNLVA